MERFRSLALGKLALLASAISVVTVLACSGAPAYGHEFCTGNHTANSKCEGPHLWPWVADAYSTNGGWSWAWVWNEKWGSDANSCQSGNCEAWAEVGGTGYGEEQMANISGKTYYYVAEWFGNT